MVRIYPPSFVFYFETLKGELTLHVGVGANLFVYLPTKLLKQLVTEPGHRTLCQSNHSNDHN